MAFPFAGVGALLGGAAQLFGGLFGGKEEKPQSPFPSGWMLRDMVKDAEASGFNPLTILRSGASPVYRGSASPALSDYLPGAAQSIGSGLSMIAEQKEIERRAALDRRLQEAQIANLAADTAARLRGASMLGAVPQRVVAPTVAVGVGGRPAPGGSVKQGAPVFGAGPFTLAAPPGALSAQDAADMGGELSDWMQGASNWLLGTPHWRGKPVQVPALLQPAPSADRKRNLSEVEKLLREQAGKPYSVNPVFQ